MKSKILLDALYINNSGGKILLDYLVCELEKNDLDIFYLFDSRCTDSYDLIPKSRKLFLKSTLLNRYKFYIGNRSKFKKVLCFGNLPPNIRLSSKVYTYFHQALFLNIPKDTTLIQQGKLWLKIRVLRCFKNNTDFWMVQSGLIKSMLEGKMNLAEGKVIIMPFYPPLTGCIKKKVKRYTYFYVSGAAPHKNHLRLIDAFCKFYVKHSLGELILTVDEKFSDIFAIISQKRDEGFPIRNLGFIAQNELIPEYESAEYVIFPSFTESFGLGLIEGIENNCKIIGADLPYTYQVCEPSIVFDPFDVDDIVAALEKSLNMAVKPSNQLTFNQIDSIVEIIKN